MENKLSIEDFQELLEREFVQFSVCVNVFEEQYREKYFKKMQAHYDKIADISDKIGTQNIFNSQKKLEDMYVKAILPEEFGVPCFHYRTEEGAEKFNVVLKLALFGIGKEATTLKGKKCKIVRNLVHEDSVVVNIDGGLERMSYDELLTPINKSKLLKTVQDYGRGKNG